MSKRFTDTQKWLDPWFADLTPEQKLLWLYLCDMCDNSGVVDLSIRLAQAIIGGEENIKDNLTALSRRVKVIAGGKYHLPTFVDFQFGKLSEHSNLHKSVISCLKKNKIDLPIFKGTLRVPEGYLKGTGKGKGKGIVKVKVKATAKTAEGFEEFWEVYPKRRARLRALKAWEKLTMTDALLAQIISTVKKQKKTKEWTKDDGEWIPLPASWLNAGCWDDEVEVKVATVQAKCVTCGKPAKAFYGTVPLCALVGECYDKWYANQGRF